jgi:hypothetical protein
LDADEMLAIEGAVLKVTSGSAKENRQVDAEVDAGKNRRESTNASCCTKGVE